MSDLTIRRATVADVLLLTKLGITTFVHAFAAYNTEEDMDLYVAAEMGVEKITAELADTGNIFFLVFDDTEAVGYAKVRDTQTPEELGGYLALEIERIYILHTAQNKRVGSTLMQYCLDYARDRKYTLIWLGVWEHNHGAIRFYERWGFSLFGSHPFILGKDHQTDVLMKKEIDS